MPVNGAKNTKATTSQPATIINSPRIKNPRLKKAIIPKASSAAPASHQPDPPRLSPELCTAIQSAAALRELPLPYRDAKAIKIFRMTCYGGWMASSDIFEGFAVDSDVLLGIVRAAFAVAWPGSPYVPRQQDVFHQTVSMSPRNHSIEQRS